MNQAELDHVLEQHRLWAETGGAEGEQVDLQDANLTNADLQDANLPYANLQGANLSGANLQGADLTDADLPYANLQGADLTGAYLWCADLTDADFREAKLDIRIRDCFSFERAKFTPDALPWLVLHPKWAEMQKTVQIEEAAE